MNLDYLNINNNNYKRNSSAEQLIDDSVMQKEGVIGLNGALMVDTGEFSGRIPNDKFIVDEDSSTENIWWGNEDLAIVYAEDTNRLRDHFFIYDTSFC